MAKMKVQLSIGYVGSSKKDVIEVDDKELAKCKTEEEKEDLLAEYWQEWANNYIEASYELVE